jgi:hypothetical protein
MWVPPAILIIDAVGDVSGKYVSTRAIMPSGFGIIKAAP